MTSSETPQKFMDFLQNHSIINLAMAAVLSDRISDVANGLFEYLIIPFLKIDYNKNGIGDGTEVIDSIKEKKIKINGVEFKIGSFILSISRFFIVAYILYLISRVIYYKK